MGVLTGNPWSTWHGFDAAYAHDVDNRSEVREFLTTRRARLTPEQVGLPPTRSRRVPGLRRSEVASIAGLSVEYYARLERGQIAGASSGVLAALARALQNHLATNALGRAFYSPVIGDGGRQPNLARFQFLDPASRDFYPDWDLFAHMCVGIMRTEAGRDTHDRGMHDLVGELSTQSETFRR